MPPIFNLMQFGRYPLTIYDAWIRFVLSFVIPFAFASFFPTMRFLRRPEFLREFWAVPLVAAATAGHRARGLERRRQALSLHGIVGSGTGGRAPEAEAAGSPPGRRAPAPATSASRPEREQPGAEPARRAVGRRRLGEQRDGLAAAEGEQAEERPRPRRGPRSRQTRPTPRARPR